MAVAEWSDAPTAPRLSTLLREGAWRVAWVVREKDGRQAPLFAHHESALLPSERVLDVLLNGMHRTGDAGGIEWRWVDVSGSAETSGTTAPIRADLWARRDNQFLFFDVPAGYLYRWFYKPLRPDYAQLRNDYAAYVSSPGFVVIGASQVVEALATGVHVDELEESERVPAVRGLLRSMAELVEAKAFINATRDLSRLERALRSSPLAEARERREEILDVFGREGRVPLVVSIGDMKPRNVVIDGSSGSVIDFEWLDLRPFWHDAFDLARRSCPRTFVNGGFDHELHAVFDAAGVAPEGGVKAWVRLSVLAFTALKGAKRATRSRFGWRRMSRSDARSIQRRWAEKQAGLAPYD